MIPFVHSEYNINSNTVLTVIDFEKIDGTVKSVFDEHFVSICEGNSGSLLSNAKKYVISLFSTKPETWIMGATAEFFVHLYMKLEGYKQECLYLNTEEGSIKKGFDGYYTLQGVAWVMESKSGLETSKDVTHAGKVEEAVNDLEDKVTGKYDAKKKKVVNNPWRNAYLHANLYDVGTAENVRRNLKLLSDDFICGKYHKLDEFNTMPCGTVFLSGIWVAPDHEKIRQEIEAIVPKLKGKNVHVVCVTARAIRMFQEYLEQEE